MAGAANVFSGPVIVASVAVSSEKQPNMGIAVNVQPVSVLGDRITVTTVCPKGAFLCALDARQAQMLIDDITKGIAVLHRLESGAPSGMVQ
ncbi:hypothetical protein [Sphingomonas sp. Marseille-Q8236]|jgi:hypothetical protein